MSMESCCFEIFGKKWENSSPGPATLSPATSNRIRNMKLDYSLGCNFVVFRFEVNYLLHNFTFHDVGESGCGQ